jgi:hypothetical protein
MTQADRPSLPVTSSSEVVTEFEVACAELRERVRALESFLVQELFQLSDLVARAEAAFVPGTSEGGAVAAIAARLGRSPAWVEKLRLLRRIDPTTRALAEQEVDGSFRMLLDLAAEPEVSVRVRALQARAGSNKAMKRLLAEARLAEADPLERVRGLFTDAKNSPYPNLPGATPMPAQLVEKFPELRPYGTIGEVIDVLQGRAPARATGEAKRAPSSVPELSMPVLPSGGDGERAIVLAPSDPAGIERLAAFVRRASAAGFDLGKDGTALQLLERGLEAEMGDADR